MKGRGCLSDIIILIGNIRKDKKIDKYIDRFLR